MPLPRQPLDGWPHSALPLPEKRRRFLLGHMLATELQNEPESWQFFLSDLERFLTRPRDRDLFGFPPLPVVCPTEDKPGLRAVMHFQGPSFLDLVPSYDPELSLWMSHLNIDLPEHDKSCLAAVDAMKATVAAATDLKRAAGLGPGGCGPVNPALHYALYWGRGEAPTDRDQAEDCALDSLFALGLDECQSLLFGHGSPDHPHLHILVNRVHPETGRSADVRRYRDVLRDWARSQSGRDWAAFCARLREGGDPVIEDDSPPGVA